MVMGAAREGKPANAPLRIFGVITELQSSCRIAVKRFTVPFSSIAETSDSRRKEEGKPNKIKTEAAVGPIRGAERKLGATC